MADEKKDKKLEFAKIFEVRTEGWTTRGQWDNSKVWIVQAPTEADARQAAVDAITEHEASCRIVEIRKLHDIDLVA